MALGLFLRRMKGAAMRFLSVCVGVLLMAMNAHAERVEPLAQGDWPHVEAYTVMASSGKKELAIGTEKELGDAFGPEGQAIASQALGVGAIDLKNQVILAISGPMQPLVGVSGGPAPSALHRVEIVKIASSDDKKTATVSWGLVPRAANDPILTSPIALALIERTNAQIEFKQLPRQDKPGPLPEPQAGAPKLLARGLWPDGWHKGLESQQWVVRRYEDLVNPRIEAPENVLDRMRAQNAARYARALRVKSVDFDKQLVAGISAGTQPTSGFRIEFTGIDVDAARKFMTIHWKLRPPVAGQKVAHELTNPARVILLNAFAGEVRFDPPGARRDPWEIMPHNQPAGE
jgi:hypothetical protein